MCDIEKACLKLWNILLRIVKIPKLAPFKSRDEVRIGCWETASSLGGRPCSQLGSHGSEVMLALRQWGQGSSWGDMGGGGVLWDRLVLLLHLCCLLRALNMSCALLPFTAHCLC